MILDLNSIKIENYSTETEEMISNLLSDYDFMFASSFSTNPNSFQRNTLIFRFFKDNECKKVVLVGGNWPSNFVHSKIVNTEFENFGTSWRLCFKSKFNGVSTYESAGICFIKRNLIGTKYKIIVGKTGISIDLNTLDDCGCKILIHDSLKGGAARLPGNKIIEKAKKLYEKDVEDLKNDKIVLMKIETSTAYIKYKVLAWKNKKRSLYRNGNEEYNKEVQKKINKAALNKDEYINIDDYSILKENIVEHFMEITYDDVSHTFTIPYSSENSLKFRGFKNDGTYFDILTQLEQAIPEDFPDREEYLLYLELNYRS